MVLSSVLSMVWVDVGRVEERTAGPEDIICPVRHPYVGSFYTSPRHLPFPTGFGQFSLKFS
jgi:hypothetical protein